MKSRNVESFGARRLLAGLLFTSVLLTTTAVEAQSETNRVRAQELFEEGVRASEGGDNEAAVTAFRESFHLFPHPGTLLNVAIQLEELGRLLEAHGAWNELLERFVAVISEDARRRARTRIEALERTLARLRVTTSPEGATVIVNEREIGTTPLAAPVVVEAGRAVIEARLEGYEAARLEREMSGGESASLEISLEMTARAAAPPSPVPQPEPAAPTRPRLVVESDTRGAMVSVDGAEPRPAPVQRAVEPGEHEVEVTADGYYSRTARVSVGETGDEVLRVDLVPARSDSGERERRPIVRRPWFWVVVGVIVIGAAAGTALGVTLSEDEPESNLVMRVR